MKSEYVGKDWCVVQVFKEDRAKLLGLSGAGFSPLSLTTALETAKQMNEGVPRALAWHNMGLRTGHEVCIVSRHDHDRMVGPETNEFGVVSP